jgi:hypothetical protein
VLDERDEDAVLTAFLLAATVGCGDDLWAHVYKPERLIVHDPCVEVVGTIVDATGGKRKSGVRREADGDTHGWIRLEPEYRQMLNDGNRTNEDNNLVFEIVCFYPVTQDDAVSACSGYRSKITLPPVGSHIRMRGSFIQDTNHAKWNELHPVSSIEVIP